MADLESEKIRIIRAGGVIEDGKINGRMILSRAIGDFDFKNNRNLLADDQIISVSPDIRKLQITADTDFLLIATDGVWDCMTSQEAAKFVYARIYSKTPREIVDEMLKECLASDVESNGGIGCDNMTAILAIIKH
jgi:serine/threonine protein phosphatase PrpC